MKYSNTERKMSCGGKFDEKWGRNRGKSAYERYM